MSVAFRNRLGRWPVLNLIGRAVRVAAIGSIALSFAACSGGGGIPATAPPQTPTQGAIAAASVCSTPPVKDLKVTPASLSLTAGGSPGQFSACTQFFSTYMIAVAPVGIVSVPASATPITNPVTGIKSAIVSVTPLAPGDATIIVTDKKGNTATVTVTVTSSTRIYVANAGNNTMTVYDEEGHQLLGSPFPGLNGPDGVAFDTNNKRLYVTNGNNSTVTAYDLEGAKISTAGNFPGANDPQSIAFDSHNHHLYVGSGGGAVTAYDEAGNRVATSGSFPNLVNANGIAFDPNTDQLYVTDSNDADIVVRVYDEQGNEVVDGTSIFNSFGDCCSFGIAFDVHNHEFYVADAHPIPQEGGFLSSVDIFDETGSQVSSNLFPCCGNPVAIAFDSHNNRLYLANNGSSTITVTDGGLNPIATTGTFPNLNGAAALIAAP